MTRGRRVRSGLPPPPVGSVREICHFRNHAFPFIHNIHCKEGFSHRAGIGCLRRVGKPRQFAVTA